MLAISGGACLIYNRKRNIGYYHEKKKKKPTNSKCYYMKIKEYNRKNRWFNINRLDVLRIAGKIEYHRQAYIVLQVGNYFYISIYIHNLNGD
jgi:hypothetical protein